MVGANRKFRTFDIRSERSDGPYDGIALAFGRRIITFGIVERIRSVADVLVRFVVLLLEQCAAELISGSVSVHDIRFAISRQR